MYGGQVEGFAYETALFCHPSQADNLRFLDYEYHSLPFKPIQQFLKDDVNSTDLSIFRQGRDLRGSAAHAEQDRRLQDRLTSLIDQIFFLVLSFQWCSSS